jgi:hypothetical protein
MSLRKEHLAWAPAALALVAFVVTLAALVRGAPATHVILDDLPLDSRRDGDGSALEDARASSSPLDARPPTTTVPASSTNGPNLAGARGTARAKAVKAVADGGRDKLPKDELDGRF